MVWFSSVALSFAVLIGAYIAPAASVALTSDSPPGSCFCGLGTLLISHLHFYYWRFLPAL